MQLIRKENFNLNRGETDTWYELWQESKGWFGRTKHRPVYQYHPMGMRRIVSGDKKWAEKIAKHYGIEVPQK